MYNLFNKFPIIAYNGQSAINIISKVKFNEAARRAAAIYYPYTILNGERPDIIAANYYEDSRYSWLIYMVNDIIDPYYDWPLEDKEFIQFIVAKYGSVERAQNKVAFWRVNWNEDESMLSQSGFDALPSYAKKYWAPYGNDMQTFAYNRSKLEYALETNKIVEVTVDSTDGYKEGEIVKQTTTGNITFTATVLSIKTSTVLIVNHVVGLLEVTDNTTYSALIGEDSSTSSNVSGAQLIVESIPANEVSYWSSVSCYDYEEELNEQRRHIKLIDRNYVDQVERELDLLLS